MEVFVETNLLKLFTPTFLHVSPIDGGEFQTDRNYFVHIPKHGCIGTVQCLMATTAMLYSINNMYITQSEGKLGYVSKMQLRGHKQMETFQVNLFRFIKRKENIFQTIYDEQWLISDLNIVSQSSLFQNS